MSFRFSRQEKFGGVFSEVELRLLPQEHFLYYSRGELRGIAFACRHCGALFGAAFRYNYLCAECMEESKHDTGVKPHPWEWRPKLPTVANLEEIYHLEGDLDPLTVTLLASEARACIKLLATLMDQASKEEEAVALANMGICPAHEIDRIEARLHQRYLIASKELSDV